MESTQRDALDEARAAFRDKDYVRALERYEYFFDHALVGDPHSLYGVRLSYCLSEWAKLGEVHPPARQRLEERAGEALVLLAQTRDPERFHDYIALCRYLHWSEEPGRRFLEFHASDPDLARSTVRFIWDKLVQSEQWSVCEAYLGEPESRYDAALAKFDQAIELCNSEPSFGGHDFEEQIEGWYVRDVSNILRVLRNTGRAEEALAIEVRLEPDMMSRGRGSLVERVHEQTNTRG